MVAFNWGSLGVAPKNWNKQANSFLFGKGNQNKRMSNFTPEQMSVFNQLMQSLMGGDGAFSDVFSQFDPNQAANVFQQGVADPAMKNFQDRIIPGIQQSFADQGPSSGLYNSLAASGRDLQQNLSSQLANFIYQSQMQNQQNRMSGLNTALNTRSFENYIQPGYEGVVPGILKAFAGGAGKAAFGGF